MSAYEAQLLFARAIVLLLLYGFVGGVGLMAYWELRKEDTGGLDVDPRAARLIVLNGGESDWPAGTAFRMSPVNVVGREIDADIVLPDSTLSSRHATIVRRDGAWWIEDLGSTNGTYLNGERLPGEAPAIARSGDVVQFGGVRLRLITPGL